MKLKLNAQTINIALNVFVIIGLVVCIILAGVVMQEGYRTALLLADTKDLAQELRQSSDDLTRFIRTYTVTGNHSYWDYFQKVIRIRNGDDPLPIQPWRNYWDLYISDGAPPRGSTAPAAILDRMKRANFVDAEMEQLTEAKRQSDALIDMEDVAYNAMNGLYRPTNTAGLTDAEKKAFSVRAPPNQTFAMSLVHGIDYHLWKGRIMRPIDTFAAMANQRVLNAITYNFQINVVLIAVLSVMLLLLIILLLVYFCKIQRDSQTAQLLSTVLPERVVDAVSVHHFTELRAVAGQHAKNLRDANKSGIVVSDANDSPREGLTFPVLYSEFLPLAWVAFTDVVNFTSMCRYTPAKVVISVLNELFSLLDVEAQNFGVEKIKTIGDAFMCAKLSTSELHGAIDESTRVRNVSRDGLEMVQFLLRSFALARGVHRPAPMVVQEFKDDHADHLELRCGLYAGPVASGIVGFERPLYDLFGDTVNTASRLESSGQPNKIQVMETTTQLFDEHLRYLEFETDVHSVALKGIGQASTRFIVGCTKEDNLSRRSKGSKKSTGQRKAYAQ